MNNSVRTGTGAGITMMNNSANKTIISNDRFMKGNGSSPAKRSGQNVLSETRLDEN
jgi:hypothetical protein